jgi:RNA polymerase sigma factor (sigma-70 family)
MELPLYLVDEMGKPLSRRYHAVAAQLHGTFIRTFPRPADPAEISNAVEETARRVARYERDHGEVAMLAPYFARVFSNVVKSRIRGGRYGYREDVRPNSELEKLLNRDCDDAASRLETVLFARQMLKSLDDRKRQLIMLSAQGFDSKEIADLFGMSRNNVDTTLHRARRILRRRLVKRGAVTSARA